MMLQSLRKLIKYIIQGIIIFLLFKYVPKNPMTDSDILLIATIVVLTYAVIENIYLMYKFTDQDQVPTMSQCSAVCAKPQAEHSEHMGNIPADSMSQQSTQSPPPVVQQQMVPPPIVQQQVVQPQLAQQPIVQQPVNQMINNQNGSYQIKPEQNPQVKAVGSRAINDVFGNESQFSYVDFNSLPTSYNQGSFESGYSFLPPSAWYPVPPHPPVCVAEKKCPVCPVLSDGTVGLKEWDQSRRITQPDEINVNVVQEKLNSGR